ncbi:hypothetical protein [Neisseria montereyensis]|uniref:Uncharacterized protein n=1 Tax=Neisseria montereyensis TaxID=2973938 RepID=A0ABT2FAE3_9NEIS|nr:hypothetical protein [Neisseria montereyensis]MCS4532709.1 hypothetical protein [Neisseria montereyensis]
MSPLRLPISPPGQVEERYYSGKNNLVKPYRINIRNISNKYMKNIKIKSEIIITFRHRLENSLLQSPNKIKNSLHEIGQTR